MIEAKNKTTNLIIGRGLISAEAIALELRERLIKHLGAAWRFMGQAEILQQARNILREFEPILAENIAQTDLAGWVAGFNDVAKQLPPDVESLFMRLMGGGKKPPSGLIVPAFGDDDEPIVSFPLIEKAAESLFSRNILKRAEFDRVSADTKSQAFTVAGDMSEDTLETIRDVLADTVSEGASLESFRVNLGERLAGSFIGPAHIETVFRTNVQTAFHDGHDALADNPIVADVFPYQAYLPILDGRCEDTHRALGAYSSKLGIGPLGLSGTNVYRRSDPFWNVFTPPWRWNCRCGINLMTLEAAARAGVAEASEWLRTGLRPPLQSRLPLIPFRPPAGFGARRVAA